MKRSGSKRGLLAALVISLLLAVAMPATSLGKDHGRHRGRRGKCGKFINCHDARNGRIDGRGPRADRVGNILIRNRIRNRTFDDNDLRFRNLRRQRVRRLSNDDLFRNGRIRNRNFDDRFDGRGRGRGHGRH